MSYLFSISIVINTYNPTVDLEAHTVMTLDKLMDKPGCHSLFVRIHIRPYNVSQDSSVVER